MLVLMGLLFLGIASVTSNHFFDLAALLSAMLGLSLPEY